ncbi:MAG: hypothetical protein IJZ26_01580 [Clostridia bacterium]|nr:hypothetical protein [Clostridia bacterium]
MNFFRNQTKYALMPLTEEVDGTTTIYAYVAAECEYIRQVNMEYEGKKFPGYEVVFKWNEKEDNITPEKDENGNYTNSKIVMAIFDNSKPAKQKAQELNEQIIKDKIKQTPLYQLKALTPILRQKLEYANSLQEKHLIKTTNQEREM